MPHDWNAAQVDDKPPGYGQGAGFTSTGTKRIVLIANSFPPLPDLWNAECLLPYSATWTATGFYQARWRGQFADHRTEAVYIQRTIPPYTSRWFIWQGESPIVYVRRAILDQPQFLWPRASFDINWQLPYAGYVAVNRMPEWDEVSRRFPAVTIGEMF